MALTPAEVAVLRGALAQQAQAICLLKHQLNVAKQAASTLVSCIKSSNMEEYSGILASLPSTDHPAGTLKDNLQQLFKALEIQVDSTACSSCKEEIHHAESTEKAIFCFRCGANQLKPSPFVPSTGDEEVAPNAAPTVTADSVDKEADISDLSVAEIKRQLLALGVPPDAFRSAIEKNDFIPILRAARLRNPVPLTTASATTAATTTTPSESKSSTESANPFASAGVAEERPARVFRPTLDVNNGGATSNPFGTVTSENIPTPSPSPTSSVDPLEEATRRAADRIAELAAAESAAAEDRLAADAIRHSIDAALHKWCEIADWKGPKVVRKEMRRVAYDAMMVGGATTDDGNAAAAQLVADALTRLLSNIEHFQTLQPYFAKSPIPTKGGSSGLKKSYMSAVKVLHPDKTRDELLEVRLAAEAAFTVLNSAWELYQSGLDGSFQRSTTTAPTEDS